MQILAISGSLRAASTNTTLRKAAAALAPEDVTLNLYDRLGGKAIFLLSDLLFPLLSSLFQSLFFRFFSSSFFRVFSPEVYSICAFFS